MIKKLVRKYIYLDLSLRTTASRNGLKHNSQIITHRLLWARLCIALWGNLRKGNDKSSLFLVHLPEL